MGTGKTIVALYMICELRESKDDYCNTLVVCPKSVINTWKREIKKHTTLTYCVLDGDLDNKLKQLRDESPDIFITTYDSVAGRMGTQGVLLFELFNMAFDILILDEVTQLRTFDSIRNKAITKLAMGCGTIHVMTGTPYTNNPMSVFAIFKTFAPWVFGASKRKILMTYFVNVNRGGRFPIWQIKPEAVEKISAMLSIYGARLENDDDLPPKVWEQRDLSLTPEQHVYYRPVAKELYDELTDLMLKSDGKLTIRNPLTKLEKLAQICSGFLYLDDKKSIEIPCEKYDDLVNLLQEIRIEDKVIIYCKWTKQIEMVSKRLSREGIKHTTLDGSMSTMERDVAIERFKSEDDIKAMVIQIQTGSMGLDLPEANYVIYMSFDYDVVNFLQSQDRIHRRGQTKTCVIIPVLVSGSAEEYIFENLKRKANQSLDVLTEAEDLLDFLRLEAKR